MTATRTARAHWEGSLSEGAGQVTLESSGIGTYDVTWAARTEDPNGLTSPEELIAAAHSSCYCMAFSGVLAKAGTPPQALEVRADVTFVPGTGITGVHLVVSGKVEGIGAEDFATAAEQAKKNCPVSQALAVPITMDATLA